MRRDRSISGLFTLFEPLRWAFTERTFLNFVTVAVGWLLTNGRHAVTGALVATGTSVQRHHSAYHRLFSTAQWCADEVGRRLFRLIVDVVPEDEPIGATLDDTLAKKKGPNIYGLGTHIDAVRSTRGHKIYAFGHVWVILCVSVRFPFSPRPWSLPVLLRLYRNKKSCPEEDYRKKTELGHQMLDVLTTWLNGRRCEVCADSEYCNSTVIKGLASNIILFGRMRPDAALTKPPKPITKRRGRPQIRGKRLPTPTKMLQDKRRGWRKSTAFLYRQERQISYKTLTAQWYRVCADKLVRVVIIPVATGNVPLQVFFCTDPSVSPRYLLERYSSRWSVECTFRDIKQFLGFADSQAWTQLAVERTAPFVAYLYTIVVMWYAEYGYKSQFDILPIRPWYRTKTAPSFEDMLAAVQTACRAEVFLDPPRKHGNFHKIIRAAFGQEDRV